MPRNRSNRALLMVSLLLSLLLLSCIPVWRGLPRLQQRKTATPIPAAMATRTPSPTVATATPVPTPSRLATATVRATNTPPRTATRTAAGATLATPSPTRTPAPPSATPTPELRLLTSFDQVAQAAQAGRHDVPLRIVFSEREVTQEIAAYLADNRDVSFSDVGVSLQPGVAVVTGKARILNFNVPFKATTTVAVENGSARLKVLNLDVLGVLVPGFIKSQLAAMIEQSADLPLLEGLPVTLESVELQSGQAVVTGLLN